MPKPLPRKRTATALFAITAVAGFAFPAVAQAELFQSPSQNIVCSMAEDLHGAVSVTCAIAEKDWVAPPVADNCHLNWGSRLTLEQGRPARFDCYAQEMGAPNQIIAYNTSISHGTLTCYSKTTDITCADHYTGHFFRISRQSYELG